ncbi:MAG: NAD(P)H-dependent oxidoreductase subunit E [candidate division WOR-3 bacterium]|nr:NAD(P)H-dependent oxidoreductase subunit E [candidate division WOR-3 bacterium]
MENIEKIIKQYKEKEIDLIQVLHNIQNDFNYLPQDVLIHLSKALHIPLSRIYSIATFYAAFSLVPRGKHLCTVCMGTACHVRGAPAVLSRIEELLGIKPGETTTDNNFTLETVNCLGACALAPIVVIDGEYHGQTTVNKVDKLLEKYVRKEEKTKGI